MTRLTLGAVVALVTLAWGVRPRTPAHCQIQSSGNGPYTIKFTNTGTATTDCPAEFGDQWFFDNFSGGLVAIRSVATNLPTLPDGGSTADPNSSVYGKGKFSTSDPDSNQLCIVPQLEKPFDGPNGRSYNLSNLSFLSTALYIGTEWKSDVSYTPAGGSACTYTTQGINPTTQCASNADCNPTSEPINSGVNYMYDHRLPPGRVGDRSHRRPGHRHLLLQRRVPEPGRLKP